MTTNSTSVDLTETRQPDLYASSTISCFFALVCVGLRFWCRRHKGANLWFDDWLILVGAVSSLIYSTFSVETNFSHTRYALLAFRSHCYGVCECSYYFGDMALNQT